MRETRTLCRSFQTTPAAVSGEESAKYLHSGFTRDGFETPDWLVPDIEDGTAPNMKDEAVTNIIDLSAKFDNSFSGDLLPRIQWTYESPSVQKQGAAEIDRLVREAGDFLDGFVVPKIGLIDNYRTAENVVGDAEEEYGFEQGTFDVASIIETARARADLQQIAREGAKSRLRTLVFGPVDFTAELGGREIDGKRADWDATRELISNAASANGISCIGGPFDQVFRVDNGVKVYNSKSYRQNAVREARTGFDGSWSLHPKQTVQANRIHMPSPAELERDVSHMEAYDEAKSEGTGAIVLDGQMVDEGTLRMYENNVEVATLIHTHHPEQTEEMYDQELIKRTLAIDI